MGHPTLSLMCRMSSQGSLCISPSSVGSVQFCDLLSTPVRATPHREDSKKLYDPKVLQKIMRSKLRSC